MAERFLREVRDLLKATEELGLALYDADIESFDAAFDRRQQCFDVIAPLAGESLSEEVHTLLLRISTLDQKIMTAAIAVRGLAQEQLQQLAHARKAALAFRWHHSDSPSGPPPRFIAERV